MAILVDKNTKVIVQGITGRLGSRQTSLMLQYGTNIVGGTSPGKGGSTITLEGQVLPVYDLVEEAMEEHEVDASVLYVPAPFLKEAAFETIESGLKFFVIITDWVAFHDAMEIKVLATQRGTRYLGPNCPGILVPKQTKLGMIAQANPGDIGVVSRSGTLTDEISLLLNEAGLGCSSVVGIGGDPVVGTRMKDILELYEKDDETKTILIIAEIGGTKEEEASKYIQDHMTKPVIAYIVGGLAPHEKRMGHAGAIIMGGRGTVQSKQEALKQAGVKIAKVPWEIPSLIKKFGNSRVRI